MSRPTLESSTPYLISKLSFRVSISKYFFLFIFQRNDLALVQNGVRYLGGVERRGHVLHATERRRASQLPGSHLGSGHRPLCRRDFPQEPSLGKFRAIHLGGERLHLAPVDRLAGRVQSREPELLWIGLELLKLFRLSDRLQFGPCHYLSYGLEEKLKKWCFFILELLPTDRYLKWSII